MSQSTGNACIIYVPVFQPDQRLQRRLQPVDLSFNLPASVNRMLRLKTLHVRFHPAELLKTKENS
ncbi:hypothetical protein DRN98_03805 [Methanosarcinales archaeon]|nr:MAG: hypothetical protein DRN98_03805 [Methanosarcinales archaeon]